MRKEGRQCTTHKALMRMHVRTRARAHTHTLASQTSNKAWGWKTPRLGEVKAYCNVRDLGCRNFNLNLEMCL